MLSHRDRQINDAYRAIHPYVEPPFEKSRGEEDALTALLTDLRHWADLYAVDFDVCAGRSAIDYAVEDLSNAC